MKSLQKLFLFLLAFANLMAFAEKEEREVAFLTDVKGAVTVSRKEKAVKLSMLCTSLFKGDEVKVGKEAAGLLIFRDTYVKLEPNQSFTVKKLPKIKASDLNKNIEFAAIRGVFKSSDNFSLFHLPASSLQATVPAMVRFGKKITVTSPGPRTLTMKPKIAFKPVDKGLSYRLVLKDIYSKFKKKFSVETDKTDLTWKETGWPELENNKVYILSIQPIKRDTRPINYFFMTFTDSEKEAIREDLADIAKNCTSKESSKFLKAVTLFRYDCLAESLPIFEELKKSYPGNKYIDIFAQSCRKKLNGIN